MNAPSANTGRSVFALAGWILFSLCAAIPGAVWSPGPWYEALEKPAWNPPNWVFAPAWTTLYVLIGISAWRVWRRGGFGRDRAALAWFLGQFVLNAAWTPVFFGLHAKGAALGVIVTLAFAIAGTIRAFARHDRWAAGLLMPYLGWVVFATSLNAALWRLNPPAP